MKVIFGIEANVFSDFKGRLVFQLMSEVRRGGEQDAFELQLKESFGANDVAWKQIACGYD